MWRRVLVVAALCAACGNASRSGSDADPITPTPDTTLDPVPTEISVEVELTDTDHELRAVAPDGTLYATEDASGSGSLFASTDAGKTWEKRGTFGHRALRMLEALSDGTLLADTRDGSLRHYLMRSGDGGRSWKTVLELGYLWLLQPHSIAELDGEVFALDYQTEEKITPIHLYASGDRGRTWSLRHVFQGYRHGHGLTADPARGELWAMLGDSTGALVRSDDGGHSWKAMLGFDGVAVDATPTPFGLLFGRDALYFPAKPAIVRVEPDGDAAEIASLPGPSYSVHAVPGGGYVLGVTRESSGDVYPRGEPSAFLFGSPDGVNWTQLIRLPQNDPNKYARADVYWHLPDGRLVFTFTNVLLDGKPASGFQLLRANVH